MISSFFFKAPGDLEVQNCEVQGLVAWRADHKQNLQILL